MKINRAVLEDAGTILQLQKRAYLSEAKIYNDYGIPPLTQTLEEINQDFLHQVFLKAVEDGDIIGSVRAYLEKGTVFIGRLIVEPEHQNQGIGTMLIQSIEKYFTTATTSADRYELFTGHKSLRNLYLYQKLGYRQFKRIAVNNLLMMVFLEKYVI
jgi:GNAT superfamily N-acetyltransferase